PDAFLEALSSRVHVLPAHEVESFLCHKRIFVSVARHLGNTAEAGEARYDRFLDEAAAKFTGALKYKQISERFKNRCVDQFNRALNALKVHDTEADTRLNHETELAPDKWADPPKDMMNAETATAETAIAKPAEGLVRVLPGKVYLPSLVAKLGISTEAYIALIADALVASDPSPLAALRNDLRAVMNDLLPACQQVAP